MRLLGIERVEEIVATILMTGRLARHRPVSIFLIAPHGNGKTSIILEKECKTATVLSDLTATGMQWTLQMYPEASHLVLTDLGVIMGHSPRAREFFFANLLPLAEEGLYLVATPKGMIDFKGQKRGVIAGTIPETARDNRKWWYTRGVARRILPINYYYSTDIIIRIKDEIDKDKAAEWTPGGILKVPSTPVEVGFDDRETRQIRMLADRKASTLQENGIDLLKQYRALARAHCALRGKWQGSRVTQEDVEFIEMTDKFVSWEVGQAIL